MKISPAVASTLIVAITDAIQKGTISRYSFFSFPEEWEKETLAAVGEEFAKSLPKALDESSLSQFAKDRLQLIRLEAGSPSPSKDTPIRKLACFSNPLNTARVVVASLKEAPKQYRLLVRINDELAERAASGEVEIKLSDRLRIVSGGKIPPTFKLSHPVEAVNSHIRGAAFSSHAPFTSEETALYLEYRTSGYLSPRRSSRALGEFFDECRAFYGACIAHKITYNSNLIGTDEMTPIVIANEVNDREEVFAYVDRVEEDLVKCANLSTTTVTDKKITDGEPLEDIGPIFPVFQSVNSNKLKTACAWMLRAQLSPRPLDRVLEATITMEVLLGDRDTSDRIGLSKLMANRCAYALGGSMSERDEIVEFFVKFYRLRSEIVHSGRTNLDSDERRIVAKGITLATRTLVHEIRISS
ncbi:MAG TPA: hypothetical protein VEZ20_00170 [Allosphingosinicella sp.]|jgi:hypothetical protein|nr:hypothetical protein [Allosphingosinicella sp.]